MNTVSMSCCFFLCNSRHCRPGWLLPPTQSSGFSPGLGLGLKGIGRIWTPKVPRIQALWAVFRGLGWFRVMILPTLGVQVGLRVLDLPGMVVSVLGLRVDDFIEPSSFRDLFPARCLRQKW